MKVYCCLYRHFLTVSLGKFSPLFAGEIFKLVEEILNSTKGYMTMLSCFKSVRKLGSTDDDAWCVMRLSYFKMLYPNYLW